MEILAADIGGTNSRFAHFRFDDKGSLEMHAVEWFQTGECDSFACIMGKLGSSGFPLVPGREDIAVFAVAGPVNGGTYSNPPLIPWDIDVSTPGELGLKKCLLINDFVAQAYASRSKPGTDSKIVLGGRAVAEGTVGVLGAGTGLGKAALIPDGWGGYLAVPSEGGHCHFPFITEEEREYQRFLEKELKGEDITYNVVVSGRGLSLLHRFLTGDNMPPDEVSAAFSDGSDILRMASRFYGRVCRNFALEVLATGGVFISGGVAAKNPSIVKHGGFEHEFRSSSTHAALLSEIPVYLITDENSGLWGAAFIGMQILRERTGMK